ncbi:hypothetical protein Hanom_Chr13g01232361 [Helianthus anomalus]
MGSPQFGLGIIDDVASMLSICALCDLHRMLKAELKSGERKVYFLMCWVSSLAGLVMAKKKATLGCIGNAKGSWKAQKKEDRKGRL